MEAATTAATEEHHFTDAEYFGEDGDAVVRGDIERAEAWRRIAAMDEALTGNPGLQDTYCAADLTRGKVYLKFDPVEGEEAWFAVMNPDNVPPDAKPEDVWILVCC
jgi:hypothetical protein